MTRFEKISVGIGVAGVLFGIVSFAVANWTRIERVWDAPNACGVWRSDSSGKVYEFRCRSDRVGPFDVIDAGKVIGDGMQVKYSVTASITVMAEEQPKHALLDLTIEGDRTLVGKFVGDKGVEQGNVRFARIAQR